MSEKSNKKTKSSTTTKKTENKVTNKNTKKVENKATDKNTKKMTKDNKKKKNTKLRLAIKIIIIAIVLLFLIGAGVIAGIFFGMFGDDVVITEEMLTIGKTNSVVLDINGNQLAELSKDENREPITLQEMPKNLPNAFVAIEDKRFDKHHGVDLTRTAYATVTYILNGGESSFGGSTITQQLVKRITKEEERHWTRKVKEMARAYQVEKILSKDQILELYLNIIYLGGYGKNVCGVEVAAQYYFNKSAKDLTLVECAYLAGINHSPNAYNPFEEEDKTEKINKRVKTVLYEMKDLGSITEEEYNAAIEEVNAGITFTEGNIYENVYSYHTDAAIRQIVKQLQEENNWSKDVAEIYLYTSGFKIYTTQDPMLQTRVEEESKKATYIKDSRKNEGATTQAAMVIMNHGNGQVLASVGGLGEKQSFNLDRATQSVRQTGSAMKPLAVIVPALEEGIITAGTGYEDLPISGGFHNFSYDWNGLVNVRYAIQVSLNTIPIQIIRQLSPAKSIEYLEKMGITSLTQEDNNVALALGGLTDGISPLEMTAAYASIANNGFYIEPTFYTKVVDKNDNVILEPHQNTQRVMSEQNAYITKSILKQPVINGTATNCSISGMDVAAKTGTTTDTNDKWLCGFTPYYTAVVWYGYDLKESISYTNGASHMWAAVMRDIHSGLSSKRFERPSNITSATICKNSGLLATEDCKNDPRGSQAYSEVFVTGTVPKETCDCHVKLMICEDTGLIANENCLNKVEKVFITREAETGWEKSKDAQYMAPKETCAVHLTLVEEPEDTNTITNSIDNNVIDNSTNTTIDNTTNTNVEENKTTNTIVENETVNTMTNTVD